MRYLLLLTSGLLVAAGCGTDSAGPEAEVAATEIGTLQDAADPTADSRPDEPETRPEVAAEIGVDEPGTPVCPDLLAGVSIGYAGPMADESEWPPDSAFLAEVEALFAAAASADPPLQLSMADLPVYDFQPEGSPKGRLTWEFKTRHGYFDIPAFLEGFESRISEASGDPVRLLSFLSDKHDSYVDPASLEPLLKRADELAGEPDSLRCALEALAQVEGAAPPADLSALVQVPEAARPGLARFLYCVALARVLQKAAFEEAVASIPADQALFEKATLRNFDALAGEGGLEAFGQGVDFRQLVRGAQLLAAALPVLAAAAASWPIDGRITLETPLGLVLLAGPTSHTHKGADGKYLLVLDVGGDDLYLDGLAASGPDLPIAVVLDLAGRDKYVTEGAEPTFGAGFLGYGLLWDVEGDDEYGGRFDSVAAACLGVGLIYDGSGNDSYESISSSQASATLGSALLVDAAGDDHYYAFRASQSYASYRAASLLADLAGADIYEAEDDKVLYPAAQNPAYNGNMSQGAGQGYRNDSVPFTDTYAGGIAILADLGAGDDIYTGGVFAQAVGYWFGAGFLVDQGGNDSYSGVWYNQGAAAHFAGGAHLDRAGDDSYYCLQDQCMGEGRDYSIGVLVELAGDDDYYAKGGRNIGSADLFGSGILWDAEGEDAYRVDTPWGIGYSYADFFNENSYTFAMFIDSGGDMDTYTEPSGHAADATLWTQLGNGNDGQFANVVAVGVDK